MGDIDDVMERLVNDGGFRRALASDRSRALEGYELTAGDLELLAAMVSSDVGVGGGVESRQSKSAMLGLVSQLVDAGSQGGGARGGQAAPPVETVRGPTTPPPVPVDTDLDGLSDADEQLLGTDAIHADTDGDGLDDGDEVLEYGTDPRVADTDGDGVSDGDEVAGGWMSPNNVGWNTHGQLTPTGTAGPNQELQWWETDPLVADTDGDTLPDGQELDLGTNPNDTDTDADGIADADEALVVHAPPPGAVPTGTDLDTDADGLSDDDEVFAYGTDPGDADSDDDGQSDGAEVAGGWNTAGDNPSWFETDPHNPDTDGDGLTDGLESDLGSHPNLVDTDGDGVSDGDEVLVHGTDPLENDGHDAGFEVLPEEPGRPTPGTPPPPPPQGR